MSGGDIREKNMYLDNMNEMQKQAILHTISLQPHFPMPFSSAQPLTIRTLRKRHQYQRKTQRLADLAI